MSEERGESSERATVARNQNVMHVLPHDTAEIGRFLVPALERLDPALPGTQLLILTSDTDMAAAIARSADREDAPLFPVTALPRATRLLRERTAPAVVGTPADVLGLVRASALKLDAVRTLIIAWADAVLSSGGGSALEGVLSEVPKDAARVLVASQVTPAVEELVERYARRARRTGDAAPAPEGEGIALRYLSVSAAGRLGALRRLLDALDPARTAVYARTDAGAQEVQRALPSFGHGAGVTLTRGGAVDDATLLVLYELPPSHEVLRGLAGARLTASVALVQPRQLAAVRALSGGGGALPIALPESAAAARSRDQALRAELADVLEVGTPARELLALEPLLDQYDGIEIAAAALRLLERERERPKERPARPAQAAGAAAAESRSPSTQRIFISGGTRDNIGPGDLVGAIGNEAGVSSDRIGKIELRDNHAIVEVAAEAAETVVQKLTGVMIRGKRVIARLDQDRATREERGRPAGGDRPRPGGDRPRSSGDRPPRPNDRPRSGERPSFGDRARSGPPARPGASDRPRDRHAGARGDRPRSTRPPRPRGE